MKTLKLPDERFYYDVNCNRIVINTEDLISLLSLEELKDLIVTVLNKDSILIFSLNKIIPEYQKTDLLAEMWKTVKPSTRLNMIDRIFEIYENPDYKEDTFFYLLGKIENLGYKVDKI